MANGTTHAPISKAPALRFGDGTGIDAGIDYTDERFIDPEYLDDHRARTLPIWYHRNQHTAVVVAVGEQIALVDRDIAELVHTMWQAGIRTAESCQDFDDDGARVFIAFADRRDADLMLSLACPEDRKRGNIWDRATGNNHIDGDDSPMPPFESMWDWFTHPEISGRRVTWTLNVTFPVFDVPELTARLRAAKA